jgi:hypothetical protein
MRVLNVHERELQGTHEEVGAMIDSLSSPRDALWPWHSWPRMEFDRPLAVGAVGGHGPVRYVVEDYAPGRSIRFRFTGPKGFHGYHSYEIIDSPGRGCVLRHTLEMTTHGLAVLTWPLMFRPMHDALLEDSLAVAQASLGCDPQMRPWSPWVRLLRWLLSGGRTRAQETPRGSPPRTATGDGSDRPSGGAP